MHLTKIQSQIIELLEDGPKTSLQIAAALYGLTGASEMNCAYVHLHHLFKKGIVKKQYLDPSSKYQLRIVYELKSE